MSILELSTLGGCSARWTDGSPVHLATRKSMVLLVYLAMAPGRPQLRGKLADLLWGRSAEEQARASLRQTLSGLRKVLAKGGELLHTDGESIWLAGDAAEVDALRLDRLIEEGSAAALEEVAGLYRGDFLAGVTLAEDAFEDWLMAERERLRAQARFGIGRLLEHYRQAGEGERGLRIARQLLALDPLQESTHRALMRLYWQQGQRNAALRQFENCTRILRQELGVEPEPETRRLYQEIAGSKAPVPNGTPAASAVAIEQQIRFCHTDDGVRIAYATVGSGPPLVKAANWLSHLEYDWQSPVWGKTLETLARQRTLIRYDERGCGLSDHDPGDFSFEAWVRDLETVVETVGLRRFPLLGISQGGGVAIAYAMRYPDRVSHLILYGAYARGKYQRENAALAREEEQALMHLVRIGWGRDNPAFRQLFTSLFLPGGTPEQHRWFNDLQRISTSPENAIRFMQVFADMDVRALAAQLRVPTLVLHATDDARVPFDEGRLLASLIPDARFVPLDSANHILLDSEPAWGVFVDELLGFIATERGPSQHALPGVAADGEQFVLVVDDDAQIRELLVDCLSDQGYVVDQADSGAAMRECLQRRVPQVVLLDLRLPGEGGLSLMRHLRARHDLGIIMITGDGQTVDRISGLELGADDYIAKPFEPRELVARVRSLMRLLARRRG